MYWAFDIQSKRVYSSMVEHLSYKQVVIGSSPFALIQKAQIISPHWHLQSRSLLPLEEVLLAKPDCYADSERAGLSYAEARRRRVHSSMVEYRFPKPVVWVRLLLHLFLIQNITPPITALTSAKQEPDADDRSNSSKGRRPPSNVVRPPAKLECWASAKQKPRPLSEGALSVAEATKLLTTGEAVIKQQLKAFIFLFSFDKNQPPLTALAQPDADVRIAENTPSIGKRRIQLNGRVLVFQTSCVSSSLSIRFQKIEWMPRHQ